MPTGLKKLGFASRQLLGKEDFETRLFGYLDNSNKRLAQIMCVEDIVLNGSFTLDADGNDKFKIEKSGTIAAGVDSNGETFDIENSDVAPYLEDVDFPNQVGNNYYAGLKHAQIPSVLTINPRTGSPDWTEFKDFIGYLKAPTSINDNGDGTLTAILDPEVTAALDCTDRKALIYQGSPAENALNIATALEECTVFLDVADNKITTVGSLGQTTISTTASDYIVILLGPFVTTSSGLATASGIIHAGRITGNGPAAAPTVFDYSLQRNATSLSTVFSDGLNADLLPSTDNTYNLGSSSKRWQNLYVANLNVNNLLPALHDTYDLGENATRWRNIYLSGNIDISGNIVGHLYPGTDDAYNLGAPAQRWQNLCISGTTTGDLVPATDDTYDLGSGGSSWKDLYITGTGSFEDIICNDLVSTTRLAVSASSGGGVINNLLPDSDDAWDLGKSERSWKNIYSRVNSVLTIKGGTVPEGVTSVALASQQIFYAGGGVRPWDENNSIDTYNLAHDLCTAFPFGVLNPTTYVISGNAFMDGMIAVITQTAAGLATTNVDVSSWMATGTWRMDAICSDGESLYVQAMKTDAPNQDTHRVFAFSLSSTTGSPNGVKSGWSSTGTLVGGSNTGDAPAAFDYGRPYKIICTSSTRVVCVNPWIISTATASLELISVLSTSDGSLLGEHSGQTTPTVGEYMSGALCSDGPDLFFSLIGSVPFR